MKRRNILVIFMIVISSLGFLYAENFNIFDREYVTYLYKQWSGIFLGTDGHAQIIYSDYDTFDLNFEVTRKDKMPFLVFDKNFPTSKYDTNYVEDNEILYLVGRKKDTDGKYLNTYFLGYSKLNSPWPLILSFRGFEGTSRVYKDASSFLIERNKIYPIENLCNIDIATPWVENAPGNGIGEGFTIENSWNINYTTLLIMNGYISYEKPYLYEQNGRIKKIRVTGLSSGKTQVLDVLDTPHPQTVDISFITAPEDLRITIEDVYPGTKYEDTCIQYLITWTSEVIPYENNID